MIDLQRRTVRELFSVNRRGTHWLFLILPNDAWAITQNGERVAGGSSDRRSIEAGVDRFTTLVHATAEKQRELVVQEHVNQIELKIQQGAGGERVIGSNAVPRRARVRSAEVTNHCSNVSNPKRSLHA